MSTSPRMILLEFNELTPDLMSRFINQGHLPNFKRFRQESQVFTTDAEAQGPALEPWVCWVTVHTGLGHAAHGVERLDQGHLLKTKRVWDLLSDAGYRVLVCGSMNVGYEQGLNGSVVPDPWCTKVPPYPEELSLYFRFVQQNVLEYSNPQAQLSKAEQLRFVAFMATHGLSFDTASSIVMQLGSERNGHNRWKRAALLDQLQFDLFSAYFQKEKPAFSTFFLNSTAHFQHSYWRSMEPDLFSVKPSPSEEEEHESSILFGYQKMDELLGKFMKMAGPDVTLVFCTALSQQPCLKYEEQGGASFYRPSSFAALAEFAALPSNYTVAPVMTHQFHIEFATEADADEAERKIRSVQVDGVDALSVDRSGTRIFTGCQIYRELPAAPLLSSRESGRFVPFYDIFYKLETMKSGMHHPDGMLWIRTPARTESEDRKHVPLTSVAPTILHMFGVPKPSFMTRDSLAVL